MSHKSLGVFMSNNKCGVVFICLFIFLTNSVVSAKSIDCQNHICSIVVDVGSTKSALHFFQFDKNHDQEPINIEEISSYANKIHPGLATINSSKISEYLDKLFAKVSISKPVTVFIYATAGMRLLSQEQQEELFKEVRSWFFQHKNFVLIDLKTISGSDEGFYGWLAVNYKNGALLGNAEPAGVLDTGGASVQIAFPITEPNKFSASELKHIKIYGKVHTIYVHSFLGLGFTESLHQLFDEPGCYSIGYQTASDIIGTGNDIDCKGVVDLLLLVHSVANTIKPVITHALVKNWVVMGGLSSFAKFSPFHFENNKLQAEDIIKYGIGFYCKTPWSSLKSQLPDDPYLAFDCFGSVYYYELLVNGYGFDPTQDIQFDAGNGATDGWALGVILTH